MIESGGQGSVNNVSLVIMRRESEFFPKKDFTFKTKMIRGSLSTGKSYSEG